MPRVGRRTRTVPPATRRALEARDRGCRFPGCGLWFTDAHHVEHWADGGETAIQDLVLLCRRHHRRVHEDGWKVCVDKIGQVVFFTPSGKALGQVPREGHDGAESPTSAAERLLGRSRHRGVEAGSSGGAPRWNRDRDIPWSIEAAAWEALEAEGDDRPRSAS